MSQKTHLQLVNKVLTLLREANVSSVGASDYAGLVSEYVNQAKEKVENAWKWNALLAKYVITTAPTVQTYFINQTTHPGPTYTRWPDERSYIYRDHKNRALVFDNTIPTQNYRLWEQDHGQAINLANVGAASSFTQVPTSFSYRQSETPSFFLINPPDTVIHSLNVYLIVPQDEFSVGTEVLLVPWRPVVSFAYALANDERGEELGNDGALLFSKATDDLALAISREAESSQLEMYPD